jgi:hypothetical protein
MWSRIAAPRIVFDQKDSHERIVLSVLNLAGKPVSRLTDKA